MYWKVEKPKEVYAVKLLVTNTNVKNKFPVVFLQENLRNDSLLQSSIRIKNDTQKDTPNNKSAKGLSPQNSIRCSSNTQSSVSPQVMS